MVIQKIKRRMFILLLVITVATAATFSLLILYNNHITTQTTAELGSMYMSEMMYQMQDHFGSIVKLKHQQALHITRKSEDADLTVLMENAKSFEFDYLALYDDAGNYETVMGETAWYRNRSDFMEQVKAGEVVVTTGYLTKSGEKYLVFGVPAQRQMSGGSPSSVLLLGFNVEKLYEYIHIENLEQFGYDTRLDIILTNGSYVLNQRTGDNTSYFDLISQYGGFVGMDTQEGVARIEKAMAGGKEFTHTVSFNDATMHIYGAPAENPGDWYFVLSMPQGATDALLADQNLVKLLAFCGAGLFMFLLFLVMFLFYLRMSLRQIKETEAAKTEAEIANNAKSSFLSNMSHDIRTPMNAMAGFNVIAEDSIRQGKTEEALTAIAKARRSSDYLRSLIGDVLDMSKIESGKLSLLPEPVSLTETVEIVDTVARVRAEMKKQRYTLLVRDILWDWLEFDQTRLNQVLINLLGNAVKFTDEGGEIRFEVWQEPSALGERFARTCFVVQDTGIGMSEEFIHTIFESFSREESRVRKIEGTGLGLAISKNLVDLMGGSIVVESKEGAGSRFVVTVDIPKAEESAYGNDQDATEPELTDIHILLAEDNDFNFDIAQVLLGNYGFTVRRAVNGEEAVEIYCAAPESWDLILMDLRMPVMDGYEAAGKIRSFEASQGEQYHVPILALSADVFEEDIKRCTQIGMDGHVSKPIDMNELLRKIKKYIRT